MKYQGPHFLYLRVAERVILPSWKWLWVTSHLSEQYKYQILLEHYQHPGAKTLAKSSMHDARPNLTALQALQEKCGQPRLLVQSEIGEIPNSPNIRIGDVEAFDDFSLSVHAGGNVAVPRHGFIEQRITPCILNGKTNQTYPLLDLSTWLQSKSRAKHWSERY